MGHAFNTRREKGAYPLKWQPEMQRREVLARVKLVSKVRYFVPLGSYNRVRYYPASPQETFRRNTDICASSHRSYLTFFGKVVTPTLMLDAPLSRTMTGTRFMMISVLSDTGRLCLPSCRVSGRAAIPPKRLLRTYIQGAPSTHSCPS